MASLDQLKQNFFDRPLVLRSVDQLMRKALGQYGAFVRRSARKSIRTRKAVSKPGDPPSNRTGLLKDFLFFAYDEATRSVIIGPAKLNMTFFNEHRKPVKGTVPEVLEYGGQITVLEVQRRDGTWTRADLRSQRRLTGRNLRYRTVSIAERPYMRPAAAKERTNPKLSALLKDKLRRMG